MTETSKDDVPQTRNGKPAYGKGSAFIGRAGASGARPANANAQRHGMKGNKLPKGCEYIENRVNNLRRQMEQAVLDAKGVISIVDAAAINSVLKWERHGLLAAHWLRHEVDKLSTRDRLYFSEAIAKASDARDRNIKALGLDVPPPEMDLRGYIDASKPAAALPAPDTDDDDDNAQDDACYDGELNTGGHDHSDK